MNPSLFSDRTTVFSVDLALIDGHLGRLLRHSPELPPGDHVPDHAGQHQDVGVLGVNLEDDRAVAAETLERQ